MKITKRKLNAFLKGIILLLRPHFILGILAQPFLLMFNTLSLTKWISKQNKSDILNDFYTIKRWGPKRQQLYQHIIDKLNLQNELINYLEFGVFAGHSFVWWVNKLKNSESRFYGFDTFEGLPENWGSFNKGDMLANIPVMDDTRVGFVKGLFQDTFQNFLSTHDISGGRRIIHLDADLFTSTLFALTSMAPYLRKGDVLLFDEFNVPNHEFFAFKVFSDSYYIKTKLLGAVNNYLQVALIIE